MNLQLQHMLTPLRDLLVVEIATASQNKSTIIIPHGSLAPPSIGIVRAVGPGYQQDNASHLPLLINVGDVVLFHANTGLPTKKGQYGPAYAEYRIFGYTEILCKVTPLVASPPELLPITEAVEGEEYDGPFVVGYPELEVASTQTVIDRSDAEGARLASIEAAQLAAQALVDQGIWPECLIEKPATPEDA